MALSFNRFILKLGENIENIGKHGEKEALKQAVSPAASSPDKVEQERPGSPFVMLLSGGNGEYNYTPTTHMASKQPYLNEIDDVLDDDSLVDSSGNLSVDSEGLGFESSGVVCDSKLDVDIVDCCHENQKEISDVRFDLNMVADSLNSSLSDDEESALLDDDERRSFRNKPMVKDSFEKLFDPSGRLVNEHELRKAIFKGGVDDDIRKDVWKFLFELYPFNTTAREREILMVEQTLRYEAMKIRWKILLRTLENDYEGVRYCPKWYTACPENAREHTETMPVKLSRISVVNIETPSLVVDNIKAEQLSRMLMVPTHDEDLSPNHYIDNMDIELNDIGLVCQEHKEEQYHYSNGIMDDLTATSYDERLAQVHLLARTPTESFAATIELDETSTNPLTPYAEVSTEPSTKDCIQNCTPGKTRTTSVNFECSSEVESLSKAIADAMLDVPDVTRSCVELDSALTNADNSSGKQEDFDMLVTDTIPSTDQLQAIIEANKQHCTSDEEQEEEVAFPNPFTLPAEYVNTQESLYSKSDQFKSLDIFDFEPKPEEALINSSDDMINESKVKDALINSSDDMDSESKVEEGLINSSDDMNNESTVKDALICSDDMMNESKVKKALISSSNDMNSESDQTNLVFTEHQHMDGNTNIKVGESPVVNVLEETYPNKSLEPAINNNIQCQISLHLHANHNKNNGVDQIFQLELEEEESKETSNDNERMTHMTDNEMQLSNFTKQLSQSCPTQSCPIEIQSDELHLDIHARRESFTRSPTGERLENVPPWIAQMIKASTPSSPTTDRRLSESTDGGASSRRLSNSTDGSASKHNDSYNLELLNIVENANRYVKEQVKRHSSGRTTPNSSANTPRKAKYKQKDNDNLSPNVSSPLLRPRSANDIFMNITPRFQCFEDQDSVDNKLSLDSQFLSGCPYCDFDENVSPNIILPVSAIGKEQLKFMEIQGQVYAARQHYNEKTVSASIRVIDKDVPRTDRELPQFSGDDNPGLVKLRDTLLTYAFFHPEVGYAQGMNDIMSRFLVVMDTESEAYWMFCNYMEHFKNDFMEEGMLRKIALVEQLLMKMDRELYDFLQTMDMGLMFCHRWLLLNFKREFDYMEAVRLFEITSSRHLEVSSVEAELERAKERAKEFVNDSTGSHLEEIYLSPEYPYDIFVCVTMLMECRHMIMDTVDLSAVYQILSNLPTTLDLQNILRKSEELFYRFCRKTVVDCFQVIDELEVQDFNRKKKFSFNFR